MIATHISALLMQNEIRILTSLRGIAAFFVLLYHLRVINYWHFAIDDYTVIIERGYMWVDFFFVLSGFIIAYVYGDRFRRTWIRADYLDFLRRRLLRIYPLHLVILLAFIPLAATGLIAEQEAAASLAEQIWTFLLDLLLVHAWLPSSGSWNGPAWSISAEWAAYLLFPVFFFFVAKQRRWLSSGFVLLGLLGLYGMSLFRNPSDLDIWNHFGTLRCFAGFCLGILVHRIYALLTTDHRRLAQILGSDSACVAIIALLLLLLALPLHDTWLFAPFGALILCGALNRGRVRAVFETPLLHGLGLISYSVYMTHWLVLSLAVIVRDRVPGADTHITALMVGATVLTLLLSVLTYRYVEEPFRHWPPQLPLRALWPARRAPLTTTHRT